MIPLRLQISNFLSYREKADLDFTGIHLACISGANGAGKSSILDGMTWALFGQSRSRSDDDLVNRLAVVRGDPARVSLIFALEKSVYRVTREKRYTKTSSLELQISADGSENGAWKTLTEGKIRETQAAIERLLRMNYDTFINASFLLQGKADEFTTKTPNKRKEVLADLLGLSQWDAYRERANRRRRETEGQLLVLDGQAEEIDQELGEGEEREAALRRAEEELAQSATRLADKEALLTQARKLATAVDQQQQQLTSVQEALTRARARLANLETTYARREGEKQKYEAILAEAKTVESAFADWQAANEDLQAWQQKADRYNQLLQARQPHELAIAGEKSRLESERQQLQEQAREIETAAERQKILAETVHSLEKQLALTATGLTELEAQEEQWHKLRGEVQKLQGEVDRQQQEKKQLERKAAEMRSLEQQRGTLGGEIEDLGKQSADLQQQIEVLRRQQQQLDSARATAAALEATQPGLRAEMNRLKERMDQLRGEGDGRCPLCGQPLTASHRREVLTELEEEGKGKGDQFRANRKQIEELNTEVSRLENILPALPRLERQLQGVEKQRAAAEARRQEVNGRLSEWAQEGAPRLTELALIAEVSLLQARQSELAALETAVQEKKALSRRRQEEEQQLAHEKARMTALKEASRAWQEGGRDRLVAVTRQLETANYAAAAQAALAELDQQLEMLAYDETAHVAARKQVQGLQAVPEQHQQLQQARAAIKPLADGMQDLQQQLQAQQEAVDEFSAQETLLQAELEKLSDDAPPVKQIEDEVFQLREEHVRANQEVAVARNRLDVLGALQEKRAQLQKRREETTQQIQRLRMLEKSFGRDGVQALLIEQALPEIEERANELLERLTGGSMRVMFATQRKLKSRDALAETLEIHISDEAGERPYDNYSGGEQFRVNFAIRLALSQLLARRAGASLQTLVIDEGFGSQDPEGRQRLIEAINTIRDDFERILVITHIDELRDAFPTRIEVTKQPQGSMITVQ